MGKLKSYSYFHSLSNPSQNLIAQLDSIRLCSQWKERKKKDEKKTFGLRKFARHNMVCVRSTLHCSLIRRLRSLFQFFISLSCRRCNIRRTKYIHIHTCQHQIVLYSFAQKVVASSYGSSRIRDMSHTYYCIPLYATSVVCFSSRLSQANSMIWQWSFRLNRKAVECRIEKENSLFRYVDRFLHRHGTYAHI